MTAAPPFSGVLFGAAYYAEYQPEGTLERDLDLMVEAGFTVIRVGESVWSTWEPREGDFDLDWLQPVLDGAHARGIGVILGTPTYAVPPWLQRLHPEIAAETATGVRAGWGARQEMDQSHPAYRFYAERVARKVVERYAGAPRGDRLPGRQRAGHAAAPQRAHLPAVRRAGCTTRYGSVESLNREWGLVYWSHRLSDWADLWRPDGNSSPQYQLEWRRFQATLATELIAWQADLVREYAREDQFVTTCISYSRPQFSDDELVASLDVVAGNPYYKMQDGLDSGRDEATGRALAEHRAVWALFQWARPRLVLRAVAVPRHRDERAVHRQATRRTIPPFPGQIKQAALALLARGGRMVEYWHWHTLHFGIETYWGGVLPHSQVPGRIYREVAELGATLKALGGALDSYDPGRRRARCCGPRTRSGPSSSYPPLSMSDGSDRPARVHADLRRVTTEDCSSPARRCACSTSASSSQRTSLSLSAASRCWSRPRSTSRTTHVLDAPARIRGGRRPPRARDPDRLRRRARPRPTRSRPGTPHRRGRACTTTSSATSSHRCPSPTSGAIAAGAGCRRHRNGSRCCSPTPRRCSSGTSRPSSAPTQP